VGNGVEIDYQVNFWIQELITTLAPVPHTEECICFWNSKSEDLVF
jgi:hypothetical protein